MFDLLFVFVVVTMGMVNGMNLTTTTYCAQFDGIIHATYATFSTSAEYSCGCGVSSTCQDVNDCDDFSIDCVQPRETCYDLPEGNPRTNVSFHSELQGEMETFKKCVSVSNLPEQRMGTNSSAVVCVNGLVNWSTAGNNGYGGVYTDSSCRATVNDVGCQSCEIIPCMFLRGEFLLDCSNVPFYPTITEPINTCTRTGMTGPFSYWHQDSKDLNSYAYLECRENSPATTLKSYWNKPVLIIAWFVLTMLI